MDDLYDTTAEEAAELRGLCRWTTGRLLPDMVREVAAAHAGALAAHDAHTGAAPGTSTGWLMVLADQLEAAGTDEVAALLEATTPRMFGLQLSVQGAVDAGADPDDDQLAHTALRDVYGTMWRAANIHQAVHDDDLDDVDYHYSPRQCVEQLRHLAHTAASRLGRGTVWGLAAALVADGVPTGTATAAVAAAVAH